MVDVHTKKCANQGCSKQPSYGIEGSKKSESCAPHAKQGMVDVVSKKCANQSCTKGPSYGIEGSKKRDFCALHAKPGTVNAGRYHCANQGCTKWPSHGLEGGKKREFCAQHAKQGMVNVHIKKCANRGCTKQASHGKEGSKKPAFCSQHAKQGNVDFGQRGSHRDCNSTPSMGVQSSKKPGHSIQHTEEDIIKVANKEGRPHIGCTKGASHGVEGSGMRECCIQCTDAGEVRKTDGRTLRVSWSEVECRGNPSVNGPGCCLSVSGGKQEDRVEISVVKTNSPDTSSRGTSRKRARRNDNTPASTQAGPARTRSRVGHGSSAGLNLTATSDAAIPVLGRDGLAVKRTASGAEAATPGVAIGPLFSPESGVTVKVE